MIRFFARIWARLQYIFRLELEAATNELHAGISEFLIKEKQKNIDRLNAEADAIENNIQRVSEMEEKGFWLARIPHPSLVWRVRRSFGGIYRRDRSILRVMD
jgi:hypothetical protein